MSYFLFFLFFGLIIAIGIMALLLYNKTEKITQLHGAIVNLKQTFDELDEQAKLIIKTDLELNKTQEELDRRMAGLDALQKASRLITTTLDEKEIFHKIDQSLMTELGFEKSLILEYDGKKNFQTKVVLGFAQEDAEFIVLNLAKDHNLITALNEGNIFSSINTPRQKSETISRLFEADQFILLPILAQKGMIGLVFVGNRVGAPPITEGEEELVSILSNQIGQSLENARLFDEVYLSSQSLERKVQSRTQQLASALEEVKLINKTKSEFISAVSHELRTPLTSIKGYASILISEKLGDIPDAVKERLEKINIHSDNLVKLINDLLDISRIESGGFEMSLSPTSLGPMIANVHDLLTPQLKDKGLQWTCTIEDTVPEIMLDSQQVERVFINLVGNAAKFTPEGGTISIHAKLEKNVVQVDVSDTGIGIPEGDIKKLFDEFYRVENQINQNVKGSGLGLALVKKIVEAHHGRIWVTSELNKGTTFHFTLPVKPLEAKT